jgi:hypothetical protein
MDLLGSCCVENKRDEGREKLTILEGTKSQTFWNENNKTNPPQMSQQPNQTSNDNNASFTPQ